MSNKDETNDESYFKEVWNKIKDPREVFEQMVFLFNCFYICKRVFLKFLTFRNQKEKEQFMSIILVKPTLNLDIELIILQQQNTDGGILFLKTYLNNF